MNRRDARRLAGALREELGASPARSCCRDSRTAAGSASASNPPDEVADEELEQVVWQALQRAGLADDE